MRKNNGKPCRSNSKTPPSTTSARVAKKSMNNCTLLDIYGVKRIPLTGDYSANSLAETMIDHWVSYIECHRKCYRADHCRYAPKRKHDDIRCGVISEAIRNLVRATFPVVKELDDSQTQKYLDGAFFYARFVGEAEGMIGMCIESDCVNFFGEYSPMVFGGITRLREHLDSIASHWRAIEDLHSTQHILLVEGQSEKAFLDELRKSHFTSFLHLKIDVYEGKGNRRPGKLRMLLDRYARNGYIVYLQGDADGSPADVFNDLVRAGCVEQQNAFAFQYDFETAMPPEVLHGALSAMGLIDCTLKEYKQALRGKRESVMDILADCFSVSLSDHKKKLAEIVARLLLNNNYLWNEDFMRNNELGRFLAFVQRIR